MRHRRCCANGLDAIEIAAHPWAEIRRACNNHPVKRVCYHSCYDSGGRRSGFTTSMKAACSILSHLRNYLSDAMLAVPIFSCRSLVRHALELEKLGGIKNVSTFTSSKIAHRRFLPGLMRVKSEPWAISRHEFLSYQEPGLHGVVAPSYEQ